jgi:hypothetical protein
VLLRLFLSLLFVLVALPAHATKYWVAASGGSDANACSAVDGDTDPGVYKATALSAWNCMSGGDTLHLKAGTYTGTTGGLQGPTLHNGNASAYTTIEGDGSSTVVNYHFYFGGQATAYMIYQDLKLDGNNATDDAMAPGKGTLGCNNIIIRRVTITRYNGQGILNACAFTTIQDSEFSFLGVSGSNGAHGVYNQATDVTIKNNYAHDLRGDGYCYQSAHSGNDFGTGMTDRVRITHNRCLNSTTNGIVIDAPSGVVAYNIIANVSLNGIFVGYGDSGGSGATNAKIVNNLVYNLAGTGIANGVGGGNGGVGNVIANNIIFATSSAILVGSGSSVTNKTAGAITDCTVSTSDFTQKSGSSCINAGTAQTGFAFNGAAPDQGPFETFGCSAAVATGNSVDVTCDMNLNTPVLPASSQTTWVVKFSSVARTTVSAGRLTGTDSQIRVTFDGAACSNTDTMTVDFTAGNVTDSALVGNSVNQPLFSFTALAVNESNCTGGGGSSPPGTPFVQYEFEDGTGTNVNDSTANNNDGTLTNSPVFGSGHVSGGVVLTALSSQYVAVPYGSGVNPSTQSLTFAFAVQVTAGQEGSNVTYFGSTNGTNQRFYISTHNSTWTIGIQTSSDSQDGSIAVTAGWHRVCLNMNSGTDIATLYIDGTASTGGGAKSYTSYTLASNIRIGSPFDLNSPGATYDEFLGWQSSEDCAADYTSWNTSSPAPTGTFDQKTHRFRKLRVDGNGDPITLGTLGGNIIVVPGAAFAIEIQTDCTVANCDAIGQRLYYNIASGSYQALPDSFTSDFIAFYGSTTETSIISGTATCCLTGSLTTTDGTTNFTAAAVPVFDLAQNASTVQRYVIKLSTSATAGSVYCFRVYSQDGNAMDTYTTTPCATVEAMSIGVGF